MIVQWIRATPEGRVADATVDGPSVGLAISRGCPQGGVLSPLLWCLLVDDLLARLSGSGVFIQGHAEYMSSRSGYISKQGIRTHAVGPFNKSDMVQ